MSYGPGPTSVGTLFANGDNGNVSLWVDAVNTPGSCNCDLGSGGGISADALSGMGTGGAAVGGNDGINGDEGSSTCNRDDGGGDDGGDNPCAPGNIIMGKPCGAIAPDAVSGLLNGCVAPESRIVLFPEGCLAAAEVQIGDLLMTRRVDGTLNGEVVTALRPSIQPRLLLETEAGHRLHCSLSHEIMVADPMLLQGRRTVVSELTLDDCLLQEDGTVVAIRRITPQPDGPVIQISLSGPEHLYLSEGLWSHNKIGIEWPSPITP